MGINIESVDNMNKQGVDVLNETYATYPSSHNCALEETKTVF